jgi:ShK domain-like
MAAYTVILIHVHVILILTLLHLNKLIAGHFCTTEGVCDEHERCPRWKVGSECLKNLTNKTQCCPACSDGEKQEVDCDDTRRNDDTTCDDNQNHCSSWASNGECEENEINMKDVCAKSRDAEKHEDENNDRYCTNTHESCDTWAKAGECEVNPHYMLVYCAKSCNSCEKNDTTGVAIDLQFKLLGETSLKLGVEQQFNGAQLSKVTDFIQQSIEYFENPKTQQLPRHLLKECKNRMELCTLWAIRGRDTLTIAVSLMFN